MRRRGDLVIHGAVGILIEECELGSAGEEENGFWEERIGLGFLKELEGRESGVEM